MEKLSDETADKKYRLAQILVNAGLLGLGTGAAAAGVNRFRQMLHQPAPFSSVDAGSQLYDPIVATRDFSDDAASGAPEKLAGAARPGLWAKIQAKRKRGEPPAKPGDKDYPDSKTWNKLTSESAKKEAAFDPYASVAKAMPDSFVPVPGVENVSQNWPVIGLGLPLTAASMLTGYKGLNALLNTYRKHQKTTNLDKAEKEYRDAIKQQFEQAMLKKTALDTAYDNYVLQLEKQAQEPTLPAAPPTYRAGKILPWLGNKMYEGISAGAQAAATGLGRAKEEAMKSPAVNTVGGSYLAGLLTLLGGTGMLGYSYGRKRQQDKIMERAILERRRARGLLQPLYAVPGSSDDE